MKRVKHLWERVCTFANIAAGAREAMRGKRGKLPGARFFSDWENEVVRLERELRDGTYRPGPYFYFTVKEPKERIVAAAPFRDRGLARPPASIIPLRLLGGASRAGAARPPADIRYSPPPPR